MIIIILTIIAISIIIVTIPGSATTTTTTTTTNNKYNNNNSSNNTNSNDTWISDLTARSTVAPVAHTAPKRWKFTSYSDKAVSCKTYFYLFRFTLFYCLYDFSFSCVVIMISYSIMSKYI